MSLILGIDPGLQRTGWGIISAKLNSLSFIACGVIAPDASLAMPQRLSLLHEGLQSMIAQYRPECAAVEETFVNKNAASSLKLGQARGALILSAQLAGLEVCEYSATLVKKTVVGNGHAEKQQIAAMVRTLLPGATPAKTDAADALAVAICHAQHAAVRSSVQKVRA